MPLLEALIGPVTSLIDKVIPDKKARDQGKLELLQLQGSQELAEIQARLSAVVAEANSHDPWTSRARPSFLYVIYVLLLWSLPMGLLAAFRRRRPRTLPKGSTLTCRDFQSRSMPCSVRVTLATRRRGNGGKSQAATSNSAAWPSGPG